MEGSDRDETPPRERGSRPEQSPERRRLAEALRENLERRKKQKRARLDHESGSGSPGGPAHSRQVCAETRFETGERWIAFAS
jgi:hypothetical protein